MHQFLHRHPNLLSRTVQIIQKIPGETFDRFFKGRFRDEQQHLMPNNFVCILPTAPLGVSVCLRDHGLTSTQSSLLSYTMLPGIIFRNAAMQMLERLLWVGSGSTR
jgi:hypothetical protein